MTLTIRTPAKLFSVDSPALQVEGLAIIWSDPQAWGGIFEAQEKADELPAAIGAQPFTARLQLADGREASIILTPSEFVADGVRPLTFQGQGEFDTAHYSHVSGE